jgi:L-2-hydroxyglutarate oxidase
VNETFDRCDLTVVAAGIVGLAVAREPMVRDTDLRVRVIEREDRDGAHQTGHNSGVVHAGSYYAPGSLKARLCVEAPATRTRSASASPCRGAVRQGDRGLTPEEMPSLDALEARGRRNDVPGLRRLDRGAVRHIEPHAQGVAALHSPATGIVDFPAVAGCIRT